MYVKYMGYMRLGYCKWLQIKYHDDICEADCVGMSAAHGGYGSYSG